MIQTDPRYWDCSCEENYFRGEQEERCPLCGEHNEDRPESRVDELLELLPGYELRKAETR